MNLSNCDSVSCLSKLISLKSSCATGNCTPMFIEDLEGVDMKFLTDSASSQQVSAQQYADQIIQSSARLMFADIQNMLVGGNGLIETFEETCSTCNWSTLFQPGGGVMVRNITNSKFSLLKLTKIEVNADATGPQILCLNDGETVVKFPFQAQGRNVITPLLISYQTAKSAVSVYLEDSTLPLGAITCDAKSGCGCGGGSQVPKGTKIQMQGYLLGMATAQQYGFKVCSGIVCSTDVLTCSMVAMLPNKFALTLLYKVGSMLYSNSSLSTRVNRTVSFGTEEQISMSAYYDGLYSEQLNGNNKVKGLNSSINDYLARNKDQCTCNNSIIGTAYATG